MYVRFNGNHIACGAFHFSKSNIILRIMTRSSTKLSTNYTTHRSLCYYVFDIHQNNITLPYIGMIPWPLDRVNALCIVLYAFEIKWADFSYSKLVDYFRCFSYTIHNNASDSGASSDVHGIIFRSICRTGTNWNLSAILSIVWRIGLRYGAGVGNRFDVLQCHNFLDDTLYVCISEI